MVGVSLVYAKGYFHQRLDPQGRQIEDPVQWRVEDHLEPLDARVQVEIEGRKVWVRAWRARVQGVGGYDVPVYYLDTNLDQNDTADRGWTDWLYGGDARYRLGQEIVLGIGGIRMLRQLGHDRIRTYHMNEGHSSLLTLELLDEARRARGAAEVEPEDFEAVRRETMFTTHTPVPAGHDQFALDLVRGMLGDHPLLREGRGLVEPGRLNLTHLAMRLSSYANGVAQKHGEVSRRMFANPVIDAITNGVHSATWTAAPFQKLYDRYLPGWRRDGMLLRYAVAIPGGEVWAAHQEAKGGLLDLIEQSTGRRFDPEVFTIGFARRAAAYKRADLLFSDLGRLRAITEQVGRLQVVLAGKAHPRDEEGKAIIARVFDAVKRIDGAIQVVYLQNYEMDSAKHIVAGTDLWLNTPIAPLEASGTSGMKAAHNAIPSLSVLDGWWIEGHREGVTGWAISPDGLPPADGYDHQCDADYLYDKLERIVLPLFYQRREGYIDVMRYAVALNASFFNCHRMMQDYISKAYLATCRPSSRLPG
jgi:starch phosphorylase